MSLFKTKPLSATNIQNGHHDAPSLPELWQKGAFSLTAEQWQALGGAETTDWQKGVALIFEKLPPQDWNHLWLGFDEKNEPTLLHRDILCEHAYLLGETGSGKTSLGITPLVIQLIRQRNWLADTRGKPIPHSPPHAAVVVIDLKGDMSLFEATRTTALKEGRTFKFFTNEIGKATFAYNPFHGRDRAEISVHQIAETFLEALNLNHGEGYGRSYYARMARRWLTAMLKKHKIQSFEELYKLSTLAKNVGDKEDRYNIFELLAVIESLSSYEQLNVTPAHTQLEAVYANAIFMPEVVAQKQVVYFWLPSSKEAATVREIAKLVVYDLLQAGDRDNPTYLIVDEFQRIVSEGYKLILEQARSMGIRAIMANQGLLDLKTHDTDLRSTVWTNTRIKQIFSVVDPESQEYVALASGTKNDYKSIGATVKGVQEIPFIGRNDMIQKLNTDLYTSLVFVTRGGGKTRAGMPYFVRLSHPMTKAEYDRLERADWPEASAWPGTMIATRVPIEPQAYLDPTDRIQKAEATPDAPEVIPGLQERLARLAALAQPIVPPFPRDEETP